jgi:hypothetical protein
MRRRRSEIEFGFDSFLDLVANVVGIILRLILVAWVGARSYKAIVPQTPLPPLPALIEPAPLPEPTDPRIPLLAQRERDLDEQRRRIEQTEQHRLLVEEELRRMRRDIDALRAAREKIRAEKQQVGSVADQQQQSLGVLKLTMAELQQRSAKLLAELEKLRATKPVGKQLLYRAPISAAVQTEELMFECRQNRVALIDTGAMLAEIKRELRAKGELLKTQWQVSATTQPVGAFRLRYQVERERGTFDAPGTTPPESGTYRYAVTGWQVEPLRDERGEPADRALQEGSMFRRLIDHLDARETVVTLWVYPDSFGLYRRLRDYLHDRGVVVAGRPLPQGQPIASSRHGTRSGGQ